MEQVESDSVITTNVPINVHNIKERRKRRKTLVKDIICDYATNTTLHGLSYTTKKNVTLIERIFWIITFISSLFLCGHVIGEMWIKWKTRPVIVTISETLVPVTEVPFPSVTICPQTKINANIYNYSREVDKLRNIFSENYTVEYIDEYVKNNIKDFVKLEDLSQICNDYGVYPDLKFQANFSEYEKNKLLHTSVAENVKKVAPKIDDIFLFCSLREKDFSCNKIVSEILTKEGLCYNINSLAAHDLVNDGINIPFSATHNIVNWTLDHGYTYYSPNAYPTPGSASDEKPDLMIIFKDNPQDNDELCNVVNSGYTKIYVQHPTDLPQSTQYFSTVLSGEVTSVALSFNVINTSQELSDYPAEKRQCYLPKDRNLKYFKIYTESNCMMECLANITYNKYKCVKFYMPHENGTRICTFTEKWKEVGDAEENDRMQKMTTVCNCMPSCYSIEYQTETLKTAFHFDKLLKRFNINDTGVKFSRLTMFYKKSRFLSMRRSELFGVTDFLANIGGILSLFLGFSFLSLFELLYFLTLRFYIECKKDIKQEKKEGSDISNYKRKKF